MRTAFRKVIPFDILADLYSESGAQPKPDSSAPFRAVSSPQGLERFRIRPLGGSSMRREAVADRIVTYCDGLVAFSLVNGFAFLVALGEPDIRCSIAAISGIVMLFNVISPIVLTLLLVWLRRYEQRLRADEVEDELVSRFWSVVGVFRLGTVWFFGAVVLFGIAAATQDTRCQLALG